ncbi:MAG: 3-deoxy-manno-octulosonate cytidylyltransferase [Rhodospirillales bacterium]
MAATRLPGKPLADIHGKPMIVHVWERAKAAGIGPVVVAAGDQVICDVIGGLGGTCILTDPAIPKGSDRIHVALKEIDPDGKHDVVVNMQGDQPTIEPRLLKVLLGPLANPDVDVATLVVPFAENVEDPNIVKVVMSDMGDQAGRCLYFSRRAVPHGGPYFYHLGFYAYRRQALDRYAELPRGRLELSEDLEQLRCLEAGLRYDATIVDTAPISVDTAEDLEKARAAIAADGLS